HRIVQLEAGRVVADGTPTTVIPDYVLQGSQKFAAGGSDSVHPTHVSIPPHRIQPPRPPNARGVVETTEALPGCKVVVRVGMGQALRAFAGEGEGQPLSRLIDEPLAINLERGPGRWQVDATIESVPLFAGDYVAGIAVVRDDMSE